MADLKQHKQPSAARASGASAFGGAPSLRTAAHEAAHVFQQAGGVQLRGGVGQAGDAHEQHADQVAEAVVRGESSEALLDPVAGGGGVHLGAVQCRAVQFDVRGEVNDQRNARGTDTPQGDVGGQHGAFQDRAADDHGPVIHEDHGHLDDGNGNIDETKRRDPTWAYRLERAKWIAKLEAAELLRPDLVDATAAYRHFLYGHGAERDVPGPSDYDIRAVMQVADDGAAWHASWEACPSDVASVPAWARGLLDRRPEWRAPSAPAACFRDPHHRVSVAYIFAADHLVVYGTSST